MNRYSFDLQTFTLHRPVGKWWKAPADTTKLGNYPVGVLPGQYVDYHKQYTPAQLRRLPLNSCVQPEPEVAQEAPPLTVKTEETIVPMQASVK